jgi:hypothetical protein
MAWCSVKAQARLYLYLTYVLDDRGFESREGLRIILFTTASRPALGPTQHPTQSIPGALSLGEKRPGREADHSSRSSAEVKNARTYTSPPQYAFMSWCSVKAQERLYLYLTYGLDDWGFESREGLGIILFTTSSRSALRPTQPPIHWVPGALSLGVRRPRREADHLSRSVPRSRMRGAIPPLPNTPSWRGAHLKHKDNYTFTFNYK